MFSFSVQPLDTSNVVVTFPSAAKATRAKAVLAASAERGQSIPFQVCVLSWGHACCCACLPHVPALPSSTVFMQVRWWGVGVEEEMEPSARAGHGVGHDPSAGAGGSAGGGSAGASAGGWATVVKGWRPPAEGSSVSVEDTAPAFSALDCTGEEEDI